jgi:hypothetical protein
MALTIMVVAAAVLAFRWCVLHLEVFPRIVKNERWLVKTASA